MSLNQAIWQKLIASSDSTTLLCDTITQISAALSSMAGSSFVYTPPHLERLSLRDFAGRAGSPEDETVGIYLRMEGDLRGHVILIFPRADAQKMVSLMSYQPPDAVKRLGATEISALAETGNLVTSHFLNAVSRIVQGARELRPTPPATTVDMLNAILNVLMVPFAGKRNDLLMIETTFRSEQKGIQFFLWILPDQANQDLIPQQGE